MGAIDIGSAATDRESNSSQGSTLIDGNNPANEDGIITQVEVWFYQNSGSAATAAIFELVGVNTFTARSRQTIGVVTAGAKHTASVSLAVKAGDFIGVYPGTQGSLERALSGTMVYFQGGDQTQCINQTFTSATANRSYSIYGTGVTLGGRRGMHRRIAMGFMTLPLMACGIYVPKRFWFVEKAIQSK